MRDKKINNVFFLPTVRTIGDETFVGSADLRFAIFDGVEKIGNYAFERCPKLLQILLSDTITEIGKGAFSECTAVETAKLSRTIHN